MTDLVEKVAAIIRDGFGTRNEKARAAILAVLEHYSKPGNVTECMTLAGCRELYLENRSHGVTETIAAAMAAELERFK